MTATIAVGMICLALGIGVGFKVAKGRFEKTSEQALKELSEFVAQRNKALEAAQVDVEIVRALREGDLGVDDLHEIGFDKVRQEATGWRPSLPSSTEVPSLPEAEEEQPSEYQPFQPLPYRRDIREIKNMTRGDEVWISTSTIGHNKHGEVTLWATSSCSSVQLDNCRCRLRMLSDGLLELAVDPDDTQEAFGGIREGNLKVKYVTILRPEDRYGRGSSSRA